MFPSISWFISAVPFAVFALAMAFITGLCSLLNPRLVFGRGSPPLWKSVLGRMLEAVFTDEVFSWRGASLLLPNGYSGTSRSRDKCSHGDYVVTAAAAAMSVAPDPDLTDQPHHLYLPTVYQVLQQLGPAVRG